MEEWLFTGRNTIITLLFENLPTLITSDLCEGWKKLLDGNSGE